MTIREPSCLGRGGAERVPGSVLIIRPMAHSTDGSSNEHGRPALGSNGLVGLVGPSALCTRRAPPAGEVPRLTRRGPPRTRNVR